MTEFTARVREQFGPAYAESVLRDQQLAELGDRSAAQALAAGEDPREVWRALCRHFDVPVGRRH